MPALASQYSPLFAAVAGVVSTLALADANAVLLPVNVRKLPKAEELLDPLPQVAVCPADRPESIRRISFESLVAVTYRVEIVFLAAGDRDFTSRNIDYYAGWREATRAKFQKPDTLQGVVPTVSQCVVEPAPLLDRGELKNAYDVGSLTLLITNTEQG